MGGTDQMDQNVNTYRISMRSKKWYWPIFTWMLDVALQNSWILYNKSKNEKVPQLDFKREIAMTYIKRYGTPSKGPGKPATSSDASDSRISDAIRYDRMDHLVIKTPNNAKRRCAKNTCKSIVRTMCSKCLVGLCLECFQTFHTK